MIIRYPANPGIGTEFQVMRIGIRVNAKKADCIATVDYAISIEH